MHITKGVLASSLVLGLALVGANNTYALTECEPENYAELSQCLDEIEDGGVITLTAENYYNSTAGTTASEWAANAGQLTINKSITIVGAGENATTLYAGLKIDGGNVTIKDLTITHSNDDSVRSATTTSLPAIITYGGTANLTLENVTAQYYGFDASTNTLGYHYVGVDLGTADGSTLTLQNATVGAFYAVMARGSEATINVYDSKVSGWSAIGLFPPYTQPDAATNNTLNVVDSELQGVNYSNTKCYTNAGTNEDWGVLVIGNQNGLTVNIDGSTVYNSIPAGRTTSCSYSLIFFNDAYPAAENVTVNITNSALNLTTVAYVEQDDEGERLSYVVSYDTGDSLGKNNVVYFGEGTTISLSGDYAANYTEIEGYIVLTVVDENGNSALFSYEADTNGSVVLTDEQLAEILAYFAVDGYTAALFFDEARTEVVEAGAEFSADTTLYIALYTNAITDSAGVSPQTSDLNTTAVLIVLAVAALTLGVTYRAHSKRQ